ncbi:MAG: DUF6766 family protein [Bryobacteraceae bacterium]
MHLTATMNEPSGSRLVSFWKNNSLTLVLLGFFFFSLLGQTFAGHAEYNDDKRTHGKPTVDYWSYIVSGASIETTFENWESEFLQMSIYVLFTVWLRQKGSAESKSLDEEDASDEDPEKHRNDEDAPSPVKAGGWRLAIYRNSLSLALILLFLLSFALHAYGGSINYCEEHQEHAKLCLSGRVPGYFPILVREFSELAKRIPSVAAIVYLTVYLRQFGSPESKPVHAPHQQTGH